jgi:hypothetical protein
VWETIDSRIATAVPRFYSIRSRVDSGAIRRW